MARETNSDHLYLPSDRKKRLAAFSKSNGALRILFAEFTGRQTVHFLKQAIE